MTVYRFLFAMVLLTAVLPSCKHHPIFDPNGPVDTSTNPIDTTGNPDTTGTGGVDTTGHPCSPDTVYFVNDIMPMLNTYCAMPNLGCHNVITGDQDIVFTNYNTVMNGGDVDPFNPGNSKLYEVITESDPDDHMPPPGNAQLDFDRIQMIYTWIMQGAQNNECNEGYGGCDTSNMTYALDIQPIINGKCIGCHNNTTTSDGINLSTLQGVIAAQNDNGRLQGSINHTAGYKPMPYNQPKLNACDVNRINAWINAGMP